METRVIFNLVSDIFSAGFAFYIFHVIWHTFEVTQKELYYLLGVSVGFSFLGISYLGLLGGYLLVVRGLLAYIPHADWIWVLFQAFGFFFIGLSYWLRHWSHSKSRWIIHSVMVAFVICLVAVALPISFPISDATGNKIFLATKGWNILWLILVIVALDETMLHKKERQWVALIAFHCLLISQVGFALYTLLPTATFEFMAPITIATASVLPSITTTGDLVFLFSHVFRLVGLGSLFALAMKSARRR